MTIKEKAQKAQQDLLDAIFKIFKDKPDHLFGPADITKTAGLFKGLKDNKKHNLKGKQNDRIAQGLINELLNQDKLEKISSKYKLSKEQKF